MNKKRENEKYWSKEGNRKRRRKINRFSMRIEDIKEKRLQEDNVGDHQFTYCTVCEERGRTDGCRHTVE